MIINNLKLVGALFYQAKEKAFLTKLVSALVEQRVLTKQCATLLALENEQDIHTHLTILFEGMGEMPAPPWGSVYLDKDNILFGASTLAYRAFLADHAVVFQSQIREPEDQFGLMLLACAYLLENDKPKVASQLMQQHFLPWAFAYLERLSQYTASAFFSQLATDIEKWLKSSSWYFSCTVL